MCVHLLAHECMLYMGEGSAGDVKISFVKNEIASHAPLTKNESQAES